MKKTEKFSKGDLVLIDSPWTFELGVVVGSDDYVVGVEHRWQLYLRKYLTLISKAEFAPATSNS